MMNQQTYDQCKRAIHSIAVLSGALFLSAPAQAAVIFDNLLPDLENGAISDSQVLTVRGFGAAAADDFHFSSSQEITGIRWFGGYNNDVLPLQDDFTITIFDDATGVPDVTTGLVVHTGEADRTDTGLDLNGSGESIYEYQVQIDPETIEGNATHWLSIQNDTSANDPWFWATSATSGGNATGQQGDGPWFNPQENWELSFQLEGGANPIPEPSSALVFGLGCLVVGTATRRRRTD